MERKRGKQNLQLVAMKKKGFVTGRAAVPLRVKPGEGLSELGYVSSRDEECPEKKEKGHEVPKPL